MRRTRGFTLVEALVALLMLNVGVLGLAAAAGAVTRMIREGERSTERAALAHARLETLRAEACRIAGAGTDTAGGFTLEWSVDVPPFPRARIARVRVWPQGQSTRSDSLVTVELCP